MGIREVAYMNIVADAGAILSEIVLAEDLDVRATAKSDVENKRDRVRLGLVGFAVAFDRAGHVEVAKACILEAVNLIHPPEHVLDQELAFTIGVGGRELRVFKDGGGLGLAVAGCSRAEDQPFVPGSQHGFKECECRSGVIAEIYLGMLHAFAGFNKSRKM